MQLFVWIFFYVSRIIEAKRIYHFCWWSDVFVTYPLYRSLLLSFSKRYTWKRNHFTSIYLYVFIYTSVYIHIYMYISHENEWHCRLKNTHDGRIGCSERRPAAAIGGTLGDGLSHRFSHTPSSIQAGAEDGRAGPRIADLTARCTESSDFRVSLAPIVALQALYLVHATRLLQLIKSNTPVRFVPPLPQLNQSARKKKPEYRPQRSRSIPPRFEALDPKARVFLLASLSRSPQASSIDASFSLSPNSSRRFLDASKDPSPSTISTIRC